jgi:type IV pilus assembly protein PilO
MLISDSIKQLDQTRQQEIELKSQFEVRASQASSLTDYREQMIQLEEMLKKSVKATAE